MNRLTRNSSFAALATQKGALLSARESALRHEPIEKDPRPLDSDKRWLRERLEHGALHIWLQEKRSIDGADHEGFEALARLDATEGGFADASKVSAMARANGMGSALDWAVMDLALSALASLGEEQSKTRINVNMLPSTLCEPGCALRLSELARSKGADLSRCRIEILESERESSLKALREACIQIKATGITLALDDFCTGYAHPSRLEALPVDELKIPRIFVLMLDNDSTHDIAKKHIQDISRQGRSRGARITVEGVETASNAKTLRELGAQTGQGYFWSRPAPVSEALEKCGFHASDFGALGPAELGPKELDLEGWRITKPPIAPLAPSRLLARKP